MADTSETTAQSHMIDLPAGRFHYISWNAKRIDLPGVLLLHGLTSSARSWTHVGSALATRYRVYALDQRGHGDSIKPGAGAYSLQQIATDAAMFLDAVNLKRPILVGHSWGGAVALVLASGIWLQKPLPEVSHVLLEDPSLTSRTVSEEEILAYSKYIEQPSSELRRDITESNPQYCSNTENVSLFRRGGAGLRPVEGTGIELGTGRRPAPPLRDFPKFVVFEQYWSNPTMSEDDIQSRIDGFHKVTQEAIRSILSRTDRKGELFPLLAEIPVPTLLMRADPVLGSALDDTDWEQAKRYLPAHSQAVQFVGATHTIHWSKFDEFMQKVNGFIANETGLSIS